MITETKIKFMTIGDMLEDPLKYINTNSKDVYGLNIDIGSHNSSIS